MKMLTAKDRKIEVVVGDKVIIILSVGGRHDTSSTRYKRIADAVRVTDHQVVLREEGSSYEERYYRSGGKIGGSAIFWRASTAEIDALRAEKKRLKDAQLKAEEEEARERNKPENILIRRICDASEDRWQFLPVKELQRIVKLLYGDE